MVHRCECCLGYFRFQHCMPTDERSAEEKLVRTDITMKPAVRRSAQSPLQFFRIFQQLDYPFEQTPSAAAINAAMIEAQCDLRLGLWNKFLFRFIPRGNLLPHTEAEQQRLIGKWNRRAPFNAECSKV